MTQPAECGVALGLDVDLGMVRWRAAGKPVFYFRRNAANAVSRANNTAMALFYKIEVGMRKLDANIRIA
jgi:hypothetical protein